MNGPDNDRGYWHDTRKETVRLPKRGFGGGNVMIWGCFSFRKIGPSHLIESNMNQFQYINILEEVMLPFATSNFCNGWVFQQDNDSKHISNRVQKWFCDNGVKIMDWPW